MCKGHATLLYEQPLQWEKIKDACLWCHFFLPASGQCKAINTGGEEAFKGILTTGSHCGKILISINENKSLCDKHAYWPP